MLPEAENNLIALENRIRASVADQGIGTLSDSVMNKFNNFDSAWRGLVAVNMPIPRPTIVAMMIDIEAKVADGSNREAITSLTDNPLMSESPRSPLAKLIR